jgi:hypothetical protein
MNTVAVRQELGAFIDHIRGEGLALGSVDAGADVAADHTSGGGDAFVIADTFAGAAASAASSTLTDLKRDDDCTLSVGSDSE